MAPISTLAMLLVTAVVVLLLIGAVIRFDVAARAQRHRFERRVRRGAARLIQEADRIRHS